MLLLLPLEKDAAEAVINNSISCGWSRGTQHGAVGSLVGQLLVLLCSSSKPLFDALPHT